MMNKYALYGIAFAALVAPALAANEFYVVQDSTTKVCAIVESKPTVDWMKVVGAAYDTRTKAAAAMNAEKICPWQTADHRGGDRLFGNYTD